ncbi:MAG: glucuronate isomerase [Clostridia bacterium]|nr:glucuronate isomerase [Clostridia bacterium]
MDENFLLETETARTLYHAYAKAMPIIDYHCHIDPAEIMENRRFDNITQAWLGGDHYKWRILRGNGVDERYITGDASDREKFQKFSEALPRCIGNPMYHWCHLELKTYFGYDGTLNADTAQAVWELCNEKLKTLRVRDIIAQSNVAAIGTTDDPADTLVWHERLAADPDFQTKVIPSYRPDKAINIQKETFLPYVEKLSAAAGVKINGLDAMKRALTQTVEKFVAHGCKASDHGLDYIPFRPAPDEDVDTILKKALAGIEITLEEAESYQTAILLHLGEAYYDHNIVMQLHYGALRNANTAMYQKLGADTGFDCTQDTCSTAGIVGLLDALNQKGKLPKTVLYSLNPNDNAQLATLIGCFQGTEIKGKLQHGSGWWFNDTKSGMIAQLTNLANLGILGNFIGMLTDSRSFLSYTRHEYFRRVLCNLLGGWIENGEYPADLPFVGSMVQDICYNNANTYFFG